MKVALFQLRHRSIIHVFFVQALTDKMIQPILLLTLLLVTALPFATPFSEPGESAGAWAEAKAAALVITSSTTEGVEYFVEATQKHAHTHKHTHIRTLILTLRHMQTPPARTQYVDHTYTVSGGARRLCMGGGGMAWACPPTPTRTPLPCRGQLDLLS